MTEAISLIVTNIIVIFGWFIVFQQALFLRKADELRKIIDLTTAVIDDIYNKCCLYYSNDMAGHINHQSTNIRAKFVLLSHYLLMLREGGVEGNVSAALTQYKIHCMGGYFETTEYLKQSNLPNWQLDLASSTQELRYR